MSVPGVCVPELRLADSLGGLSAKRAERHRYRPQFVAHRAHSNPADVAKALPFFLLEVPDDAKPQTDFTGKNSQSKQK